MKRTFATAAILSLTLLGAGTAFGRPSAPDQGASADSRSRTILGVVTEYRVGKWLAVRTADKSMESFKLDEEGILANVSDAVAVGTRVKVTERVAEDGKRTVTVEPMPLDAR